MVKSLAVILPNQINHIRNLSDAEYSQYKAALQQANVLITYQTLFSVMSANYDDYYETGMRHLQEYTQRPGLHERERIDALIDINRSVINYLSSCRAYTDHCKVLLTGRFGPASDEWKRYKRTFDEEYKHNFSLRLMSALRNSAQHQAMPVAKLELTSHLEEQEPPSWTNKLIALSARDPMLGTRELPDYVRQEIQALPPLFDIYPHMVALWESITRINFVGLNLVLREAAGPVQFLAWLIRGTEGGEPCITEFDSWTPHGRSELHLERFPMETIEMVMEILENKDNKYRRNT